MLYGELAFLDSGILNPFPLINLVPAEHKECKIGWKIATHISEDVIVRPVYKILAQKHRSLLFDNIVYDVTNEWALNIQHGFPESFVVIFKDTAKN